MRFLKTGIIVLGLAVMFLSLPGRAQEVARSPHSSGAALACPASRQARKKEGFSSPMLRQNGILTAQACSSLLI